MNLRNDFNKEIKEDMKTYPFKMEELNKQEDDMLEDARQDKFESEIDEAEYKYGDIINGVQL